MADLDSILTQLPALNDAVVKIRAENASLRATLTEQNAALVAKVAELELLVASGGPAPAKVEAIAAGLAGLRTLLGEFDADVPDPVVTPA